jgi:Fe-S-cluster containining protein
VHTVQVLKELPQQPSPPMAVWFQVANCNYCCQATPCKTLFATCNDLRVQNEPAGSTHLAGPWCSVQPDYLTWSGKVLQETAENRVNNTHRRPRGHPYAAAGAAAAALYLWCVQ